MGCSQLSLVAERLAATSAVSFSWEHKNKQKNLLIDKLSLVKHHFPEK